ncbi:D-aminoacyl-tRNA deacylase [Gordonia sp. ABSL1-1]|uniref:D-aminoacyl-tRNA deacylase n=1 Tax=Gordonia sp. ABSL1-1 TaxID=3053923 RepID=UPI0025734A21|nr:D-aminoacyl-tRNA deacylase [Gordonia sp. ABSL1-1]MDL9936694.1 D-aminoacyl-tRNA deacylase [Gordonia sp. ABSL1-1]
MRAVVQRVTAGHVVVDDEVIARLDVSHSRFGLVVLVGVTHTDTPDDAAKLADKIWRLRIFDGTDSADNGSADKGSTDNGSRAERAAADIDAPILVISQFTLYANTAKGRRPSWNAAAPGSIAEPLVDAVVGALRSAGATVETGRFGADMKVHLVNDGPVTILLES